MDDGRLEVVLQSVKVIVRDKKSVEKGGEISRLIYLKECQSTVYIVCHTYENYMVKKNFHSYTKIIYSFFILTHSSLHAYHQYTTRK